LFDPTIIVNQPLHVLATLAIVVVGKTLAAMLLVLVLRYPLNTALTVGVSLAQIGEFSFILAGLGLSLGLLSKEGHDLILAAALISIAINPLLFRGIHPLRQWLLAQAWMAKLQSQQAFKESPLTELPTDTDRRYLSNQVVIIGWNSVSQRVASSLSEKGVPVVLADDQRDRVEDLRNQGMAVVWGDPKEPDVLLQAHIKEAAVVVVTALDPVAVQRVCEVSRSLNPKIQIIVMAGAEDESQHTQTDLLMDVVTAEDALVETLINRTLARLGTQTSQHDASPNAPAPSTQSTPPI
jgi:CPA2 family monovalent cation:H+ antiporter-2